MRKLIILLPALLVMAVLTGSDDRFHMRGGIALLYDSSGQFNMSHSPEGLLAVVHYPDEAARSAMSGAPVRIVMESGQCSYSQGPHVLAVESSAAIHEYVTDTLCVEYMGDTWRCIGCGKSTVDKRFIGHHPRSPGCLDGDLSEGKTA